jgi:hypothetical protein
MPPNAFDNNSHRKVVRAMAAELGSVTLERKSKNDVSSKRQTIRTLLFSCATKKSGYRLKYRL